jgi:membrane-bound lytic murein transglycosylase D
MPAEDLKTLNPHILHWCTHPSLQHVTLYLPKGAKEKFVAAYNNSPSDFKVSWETYQIRSGENLKGIARHFGVPLEALLTLNNFQKNIRLAVGEEISIPLTINQNNSHGAIIRPEPPKSKHYTEIDVSGMRVIKYKVRSGDCVGSLAQIFRVNKTDLCKWNHLSGNKSLKAGMVVTIYKPAGPSAQSLQPSASAATQIKQVAAAQNISKISTSEESAQGKHIVYYKVRKGDNLWNIAQSFKVPIKELTMMNNLQSDSSLVPGEVLKVPMTGEL